VDRGIVRCNLKRSLIIQESLAIVFQDKKLLTFSKIELGLPQPNSGSLSIVGTFFLALAFRRKDYGHDYHKAETESHRGIDVFIWG
jgi:hypothetical protein